MQRKIQTADVIRRKPRKKEQEVLNNVVSLRLSDQEKHQLDRVTAATRKNVSDVVREAIEFWLRRKGNLLRHEAT
jgi:Arc/MetJ-type ribon-helix-helix transcriptional regulator